MLRPGIDRGVHRRDPEVARHVPSGDARVVAHRRHDEQIARAGGGDVGDAHALRAITRELLVRVLDEIPWLPAAEPERAQSTLGVHVPARVLRGDVRGDVRQDHDRKLEPLRPVHGHDPHALGALLDDRGLARGAALRVRVEPLDEGPERRRARGLEAPRQVHHAQHVRERLLAPRPQHEGGMRAGRRQQTVDGVLHRAVIAQPVERAKERERVDDRLE